MLLMSSCLVRRPSLSPGLPPPPSSPSPQTVSPTGHLMFEMCCGYELTELAPTQTDYQVVRYKSVVEVRKVKVAM